MDTGLSTPIIEQSHVNSSSAMRTKVVLGLAALFLVLGIAFNVLDASRKSRTAEPVQGAQIAAQTPIYKPDCGSGATSLEIPRMDFKGGAAFFECLKVAARECRETTGVWRHTTTRQLQQSSSSTGISIRKGDAGGCAITVVDTLRTDGKSGMCVYKSGEEVVSTLAGWQAGAPIEIGSVMNFNSSNCVGTFFKQ